MKLLHDKIKRLGIYFFFDKDGVVDDFITYYLADLIKSLDRLVVVCNGRINSEGTKKIKVFTNEIIVRPNEGLDVWAYKTAFEFIGWETCRSYDEVVICNSTVMGPIFSFSEMFHEMSRRDVDFWGITKTHQVLETDFGYNPYGYLPEHIQSYFCVYRKCFLQSIDLKKYWDDMPMIVSYEQSIGLFESAFTKIFSDKGFVWDVYVDTDEYREIIDQPLMFYPAELIAEKKCPVFKRRTFFHDYNDTLSHTAGQSALLLYKYLVEKNLYDVDMIWQTVLRCYSINSIANQMHLNYTLSTTVTENSKILDVLRKDKTAFMMHLYFEDLFLTALKQVMHFPKSIDVYISTDSVEKMKKINTLFSVLNNKVEVRVVKNRGRDVSALLVGMRDIVNKYDLICFSHDKKTTQVCPGSVGESFAYQCYTNILHNSMYIKNIILLFENNPKLGMAVPPAPNHGVYHHLKGENWKINYENTKELCRKLDINVIIDKDISPIAPYGSVFWFRPCAMKKIFSKEWKYQDFHPEPLAEDGTISHAIERVYAFAAQSEGYYSAVVMSDEFARIQYTNQEYYLQNNHATELLKTQLQNVYKSTSWKVSTPVRLLGEMIKNLKRK